MKPLRDVLAENTTRLPNGCLRWDGDLHPYRSHVPMARTSISTPAGTSWRPVRRLLWLDAGRKLPRRDVVRPTCGEPLCVEFDHLAAVTRAELSSEYNVSTGRCKSGRHDLTIEANVRRDRGGRRNGCVPCLREKQRAYSIAERDDGRLAARKRRNTAVPAAGDRPGRARLQS